MSDANKMSLAELNAALRRRSILSKYRNERVMVDGLLFDSKREARRWGELQLLEKVGEIQHLRRQVRYDLTVKGVRVGQYVADFVYTKHNRTVVEDAKGVRTQVYRLKRKLMQAIYDVDIVEV